MDDWPTVRVPVERIEQLEAENDRLAKQNEIMRQALKRTSELALTRSTDAGGIRDQGLRKALQRIRELNEGLNENESFLEACELAKQALKAAEGVE